MALEALDRGKSSVTQNLFHVIFGGKKQSDRADWNTGQNFDTGDAGGWVPNNAEITIYDFSRQITFVSLFY